MDVMISLVLGFIPTIVWLAFFVNEDKYPEPRSMLFKAFVFGGLSAVVAFVLEYLLKDVFSSISLGGLTAQLASLGYSLTAQGSMPLAVIIGFATIEEVVKFLFVWRVIKGSVFFDEPIDAMIYMATGALGFAAAENLVLSVTTSAGDVGSLISLRFIGANLLHALSSSVVGYFWARGFHKKYRPALIVLGLVLASIIHAVFNYLISYYQQAYIYPTGFLVIVGFFVLLDFERVRDLL